MRPDMARYFLMSTCGYGPMITATGGINETDMAVHRWVCAIMAHQRSKDAKPTKAAA